jgi:hypothetical protein
MTEEKQEEIKPIVQLQELRKSYPEINDVQINKDIINILLNNIYNSSTFGQKMEGVIFGRQTEKQLIISTLIPCTITHYSNQNIVNYLETSRLDNTKIGFYFCDNGEELLSHNKLKTFIEFQKIFPNCVILTIDINAVKTHTFPFKCFRISQKVMDKFEEEEIEENIYLNDKNILKEFYKQMFKKLNSSTIDLIQPLKLTSGNDILDIFEIFAEKEYAEDDEKKLDNNYYYTKDINYNLNRKIKQLNKGCEKLIEEQKKYINYYKNKKMINNENVIKNENRKGMKGPGSNQGKLNEEKFDLIDFGLYSQNIKEMNNSIKNIMNKKEIDSFTAYNLAC